MGQLAAETSPPCSSTEKMRITSDTFTNKDLLAIIHFLSQIVLLSRDSDDGAKLKTVAKEIEQQILATKRESHRHGSCDSARNHVEQFVTDSLTQFQLNYGKQNKQMKFNKLSESNYEISTVNNVKDAINVRHLNYLLLFQCLSEIF